MCQRIHPICSSTMYKCVIEHVWVCACTVSVLMCGESFHACVGIMNGSAIICQHTHFYSPSLQLCVLWTMWHTTLQLVSITAHISTDTLPMDPNFHKLSVLTLHCIVNWQIHREWKGGEGRMKLSNANQPTASIGIVHHVYITCPYARTIFTDDVPTHSSNM